MLKGRPLPKTRLGVLSIVEEPLKFVPLDGGNAKMVRTYILLDCPPPYWIVRLLAKVAPRFALLLPDTRTFT